MYTKPLSAVGKYIPHRPIGLKDRTWPDQRPSAAPRWCSVDLRDGNQALLDPMDIERKIKLFNLLVQLGFSEIEVGFPTASKAEWDFLRELARRELVPEQVTVQIMSPMRADHIERSVESLAGIPKAIVQIYNPISPVQRADVFGMSRAEIKAMAVGGAQVVLDLREKCTDTLLSLQYGAESFTQTEPEFALEVCNAVLETWAPRPGDDVRINLPATVEAFPPQEFGDRIEWMHRNLLYRDEILLSVHPHNDRGTAVAATEIAVLAGADRVEGTLFGNGERTGNVCLITLAMNLFTQGIEPGLDLSHIDDIRRVAEECTGIAVHPRHPWAGDLVYTSFAGSHQDAISKTLVARAREESKAWDIPYLPVDPSDVGRSYSALVRINSQSGKGGISYLLKTNYGIEMPRRLQIDFSAHVQSHIDEHGGEMTAVFLLKLFESEYEDQQPSGQGARPLFDLDLDRLEPGAVVPDFLGPGGPSGQVVSLTTQALESGVGPDKMVTTAFHRCYCEIATAVGTVWGAGRAATARQALAWALRASASRASARVASALGESAPEKAW